MKSIFATTTKSNQISKAIESTRAQIAALTEEAERAQSDVDSAISSGKSPDAALTALAGAGLKIDALSRTLARLEQEHVDAESRELAEQKAATLAAFKSDAAKAAKCIEVDFTKAIEAGQTMVALLQAVKDRHGVIVDQAKQAKIDYRGAGFSESINALFTLLNNPAHGLTVERVSEIVQVDLDSVTRLANRATIE
jgi:hypothetical protein